MVIIMIFQSFQIVNSYLNVFKKKNHLKSEN